MRLTGAAPSPRARTHTHIYTHTDTHRHTHTRAPRAATSGGVLPPDELSCFCTVVQANPKPNRSRPSARSRYTASQEGGAATQSGQGLVAAIPRLDGYLLAWGCFIYALLFYRSRRVPVALVLFAFGLVVAIVRNSATDVTVLDVAAHANGTVQLSDTVSACGGGANRPTQGFGIHWPTTADWATGFVHMAIPQIPLTTMNSVIAVCKLSDDLFPNMDEKHKATPRRVSPTLCPLIVPSFVLRTQDNLAYNGRGGGACCACSCKHRLQARSG